MFPMPLCLLPANAALLTSVSLLDKNLQDKTTVVSMIWTAYDTHNYTHVALEGLFFPFLSEEPS